MQDLKVYTSVMAYLSTFWLGAKMVILTNKMELSTYDWVSLGINIFFVGFFIWNANSNSNNKQIL
jgi:hypothetical protein